MKLPYNCPPNRVYKKKSLVLYQNDLSNGSNTTGEGVSEDICTERVPLMNAYRFEQIRLLNQQVQPRRGRTKGKSPGYGMVTQTEEALVLQVEAMD
ncbi:hypothetical protein QE152_g31234 [Popillia japonica]|uniref:Uncharacterized protein n=1 Tax=Popillia japonica TaxID=7064 RepID=A0AAW1JBQ9_POPJA